MYLQRTSDDALGSRLDRVKSKGGVLYTGLLEHSVPMLGTGASACCAAANVIRFRKNHSRC